jgi:hypothetical protein
MGGYTDNQKFYLIGGSELVSVENNLNYNLRRADERVKALVEYQITDVPSITNSGASVDVGYKWYKQYTNALYNYRLDRISGAPGFWQDANAQVDSWTSSVGPFEPNYGSQDLGDNRIGYSIFNGFVRWRGRLSLTSGGELPANTLINFLTPPTETRPERDRHFFVCGGDSATNFQTFYVLVPAAGSANLRMRFVKYGGNAKDSSNRYISLNSIQYPLIDH